jgi:hypothetical protein
MADDWEQDFAKLDNDHSGACQLAQVDPLNNVSDIMKLICLLPTSEF